MTMPVSNSVATHSIDRAAFENFYAGPAPWDIGKPQKPLVAVADQVTGSVLDAGCGSRASTSSRKRSTGPGGRQPTGQ